MEPEKMMVSKRNLRNLQGAIFRWTMLDFGIVCFFIDSKKASNDPRSSAIRHLRGKGPFRSNDVPYRHRAVEGESHAGAVATQNGITPGHHLGGV